MNPWQQLGCGRSFAAFQGRDLVLVSQSWQTFVAIPAVSMNNTSRFDGLLDESVQSRFAGVRDAMHPNPTQARSLFLRGDGYQRFSASGAAARTDDLTAHKGLVHLYATTQSIASRPHHRPTHLVQPQPSGCVATQPQGSL